MKSRTNTRREDWDPTTSKSRNIPESKLAKVVDMKAI